MAGIETHFDLTNEKQNCFEICFDQNRKIVSAFIKLNNCFENYDTHIHPQNSIVLSIADNYNDNCRLPYFFYCRKIHGLNSTTKNLMSDSYKLDRKRK